MAKSELVLHFMRSGDLEYETPLVIFGGEGGVMSRLIAAAGYRFHVTPDPSAPGAHGIQHAINVFAVYALLAAAAGFLLGAATWAIGGRIGNEFTAVGGKLGMAVSLVVAFLVGGAAVFLNFAYSLG
jgi:hypothetical protein